MYLVNRIEETTVKYHDARQVIGRFIMNEQGNLHNYTIDEIADKTYTSKATVTRYAKLLGYSGWREFIREYMLEINYLESHKGVVDVNQPFKAGDSDEVISDQLQALINECVADTREHLDYGLLRMAVRYLEGADRIVIFGMSPNLYLGELFARKLQTIGKTAMVVNPSEFGITSYTMSKNDCAVIISYSGSYSSHSSCVVVPRLREQNVPIIGITGGGDSYLRQNTPCILHISSRERLYSKIANFATEESINYLLNLLFSCLFERAYDRNFAFKVDGAKLLEQDRTAVLDEMKEI
ncbi:MAG: MurR/RpiR family transcriptional regulator [Solobacterium sp.]|nr:MurR/RpiR family transcriptional regulator [Solobacterium sp.]